MPWVKLDDQFTQHPKVLEAGPMAAWFHVCGLAYCARYLTDGFIPVSALPALADFSRIPDTPGDLAHMLVTSRLWEECEGGFKVHDYLEYNPSKAETLAARRATADRVAKWKRAHKGNAVTNALPTRKERKGNAVTNAAPVPHPHPVPLIPSPLPDWAQPLTTLKGYRPGAPKTIEAIRLECARQNIEASEVVKEFASYWPIGQVEWDWKDPVAVLRKTIRIQIDKTFEARNRNGRPPAPTGGTRMRQLS